MRDELLSPNETDEENDSRVDMGLQDLRPDSLNDFVGQEELKEHLEIILGAAQMRGKPSDHLLFAGPPGLGKTTLAILLRAKWALLCTAHPVQRLKEPET